MNQCDLCNGRICCGVVVLLAHLNNTLAHNHTRTHGWQHALPQACIAHGPSCSGFHVWEPCVQVWGGMTCSVDYLCVIKYRTINGAWTYRIPYPRKTSTTTLHRMVWVQVRLLLFRRPYLLCSVPAPFFACTSARCNHVITYWPMRIVFFAG
jgi:hypothetical protein